MVPELHDFVILVSPGVSLRQGLVKGGVWKEMQLEGEPLGAGVMITARGGRLTEKASKCTQSNLLISQVL